MEHQERMPSPDTAPSASLRPAEELYFLEMLQYKAEQAAHEQAKQEVRQQQVGLPHVLSRLQARPI